MAFSWKLLAAVASAAVIMTGCSSVSLDKNNTAGTEQSASASSTDPFSDPNNPLSHRSIYFAFDSYDVQPEYTPIVEAHAKWMIEHPDAKVVVQGNTDNRGGREYNLALGQKRSEAVKQRLVLLGVPSDRIESVSFGEEKPVATGNTPEAYAQNRRADIVYKNDAQK